MLLEVSRRSSCIIMHFIYEIVILFVATSLLIKCTISGQDNDLSIYYKVNSRNSIHMPSIDRIPQDFFRIGRRNPCSCIDYTCGCCTGINITQFNFDQVGCMNFTYDPFEFAITMNMLFNEKSVYMNTISAKNPPPFCIPVPIPYIPNVDFCVKIFNIFTPGRNLHMCVDFETRVVRATVLILHFDCIRMGTDGVALVKPEDNGGLGDIIVPPEVTTQEQSAEVYDNVTDIKNTNNDNITTDINDEV